MPVAPAPASLLTVETAPVPSPAETPVESSRRFLPPRRANPENARTEPPSQEDRPIANLPADARSDASGYEDPAAEVAFEALLTPVSPAPSLSTGAPAQGNATQEHAPLRAHFDVPGAAPAAQTETSADLASSAENRPPAGDRGSSLAAEKPRPAADTAKTDAAVRPDAVRKPATASPSASPVAVSDAPPAAAVRGGAGNGPAGGPGRSDAAPRSAPETADASLEELQSPDQPRPAVAAHDMRFAVGGGNQRVEVRVAERGGEVQVAVRTSDPRLAGSLRDDLPSLAAKLESAGLRTETWSAASPENTGRERQGDGSSRALPQNSQQQPGQDGRRQRDDAPPQRPKPPADSSHPKPDRKDFQWHFTSLQ